MLSLPSSAAALVVLCCLLTPSSSNAESVNQPSKHYKVLFFPYDRAGSHFRFLSQFGKVLARQGHKVTLLLVDSKPRRFHKCEADWFSTVVYKSRFTEKDKNDGIQKLTRQALRGERRDTLFILKLISDSIFFGLPEIIDVNLCLCDDLLGDTDTINTLISEKFDRLVGDSAILCLSLLAQKLDIPFVAGSSLPILPAEHALQYCVPADPSYIPEWSTRSTDTITFVQRVQNFLSYAVMEHLHLAIVKTFQQLKIKHNIKPEISMLQSIRQAKLIVFNLNYPLEYPRPLYPNMILSTPKIGSLDNKTVNKDVAAFLDTASAGFVIFSLGGYVTKLEQKTTQMIADAFASVPYRVLWQTTGETSKITFGSNTKVVNWVPLAQILNYKNAKVFISHCGVNSVLEATWAGLPIVGIPLFGDQFPNIDKVVARGFGMSLELADVTTSSLSEAIKAVAEDPQFRERALHASAILRDMVSMSSPAETVADWIIHVIEFGNDHLRPFVDNVNCEQGNIDVYLFLALGSMLTIAAIFFLCYFCCTKWCKDKQKKE